MTLCERCDTNTKTEEHHISYEEERTVELCKSCHRQVHADEDSEYHPVDDPPFTTIKIDMEQKERLNHLQEDWESYADVLDRIIYGGELWSENEIEEVAKQAAQDVIEKRKQW